MRKVIFIIGSLGGGGAERVVSNISRKLPSKMEKFIVLYGKQPQIAYKHEGSIIQLDQDCPSSTFEKMITLIKRLIKIRKLKKNNPNVPVISFLELPNLINVLTSGRGNAIISVRNFMSEKYKKGIKSMLWNLSFALLYRRAYKIITVSQAMKEDMVKTYKLPHEKIEVIYNFYDIDEIQKLSSEEINEAERLIFDNPTIITVGRLSKQKGQSNLIKALAEVKKAIHNAQLVILGEGKLEQQLKALAYQLGINDSVHFLGFQTNPFKYIAKSNVFALTSYFEGFPNALAEAMACKVPVLSTDCKSGPREILAPDISNCQLQYGINIKNDIYGVLLPDPSYTSEEIFQSYLENSLIEILSDEKIQAYFAEKSYERIMDFEVNKIIGRWLDLINNSH